MEVTLQSFKKRFTYDPAKDLLGKGGFGEVFKAYDTEDQIFVALKISYAATDDKHSLINEIKRFKKLNHPNIVKHIEAYEVNTGGTDIHGRPIISHVGILEYADSGTLADLLKKGKPDNRITEELARDIIDGLAYLHSNNIIHRDLKPTNILLFSEGEKLRAKITDFGIAKRSDATAASTQLVGTVEYMAPEYFTTGNVSTASDIWSVGVLLLEALTGVHPFGKTTQGLGNEQIINNILNKDLSTVTQNLHAPFKEIITRCLLRETNLRPQSATELIGLLQQSGGAFSEKTQVIDLKKKNQIAESKKGRLKRWWSALFDFDVKNGKWKQLIAKEIIVAFLTIPFFIITVLLFLLLITPYRVYQKKTLETELHDVRKYLSENQRYSGKLLEFSKSYFTVSSRYPENNPTLYPYLGFVYDIFRDVSIRSKHKKENLEYFDISNDYYDNSYRSFYDELNRYSISKPYLFNHLEEQIKLYNQQNRRSIDLRLALSSIDNLVIVYPSGGGENYYLNDSETDFYFFCFRLRGFIKRNEKEEVKWLYAYRASRIPSCNKFLLQQSVKDENDFYTFLKNSIDYQDKMNAAESVTTDIYGYDTFPLDWRDGGLTYGMWIGIILLALLYPFRFLVSICLWTFSTLKKIM